MNSVYIYDGLPNFVSMSRTHPAHSLGVFCTRDSQYPLTIEGVTGKQYILIVKHICKHARAHKVHEKNKIS